MTMRSLFLAAAVFPAFGAVPAPDLMDGWHVGRPAKPDEAVQVIVQVRRPAMEQLKALALAVSTPGSPKYSQFLSAEEARSFAAPKEEDTAAVRAWLQPASTRLVESPRGVLHATLRAADAARLLATEFRVVYSTRGGAVQEVVRAGRYSLPPQLQPLVEAVHGLHGLPLPERVTVRSHGAKSSVGSEPVEVLPAVIRKLYGFEATKASGNPKVRQAVAEFQGQLMNQTDVDAFFAQYVPGAAPGDSRVFAFHGEPEKGGDGIEAMLDIEYMMGVSPGLKTEVRARAE
jgi:tripeptidyl-peptidase-1